MAKSKSRSEVEFLRGELRNLRSENKALRKQLGIKNKREHLYSDLEERQAEVFLEEEHAEKQMEKQSSKKDKCPSCSSYLELIVDTDKVKVYFCSSCKYRKSKRSG